MSATLIANVSIFDGTGAASFPGEILVEGTRIARVATGNGHVDAPGAEMIDGKGGTLIGRARLIMQAGKVHKYAPHLNTQRAAAERASGV